MNLIRSLTVLAGMVALLSSCQMGATGNKPKELAVKSDSAFVLKGVSKLTKVSQITGFDSKNKTNEYEVFGTDLGSMINAGDKTYLVFGDTFGYRSPELTGGGGADWRSNTIAITTDKDPSDGLTIDRMISDYGKHAKELLPSAKVNYEEMTKIPTHGVAVGDNLYLYFMSVNNWGPPGTWTANYGGMAKSEDQGEHWKILENVRWPGDSNYIQVSPYKVKVNEGLTEIYLWSIPAGRSGGVKLMKVDEKQVEDMSKYVYFTGVDKNNGPIWSEDMNKAKLVVQDDVGVGELSVIWNPYLNRWIMTYLKEGTGIVIREGLSPWGPWSDSITLVSNQEYPGQYGPFMNPKYMEEDGKTIYFTLSLWDPYNVFWMKATLDK